MSPRLTWGDGARLRAIADQVSLQHLVEVGERLQRDAAALLDRAAFDGEEIPAAAVEATVRFAEPTPRAAFLDEYLALTARLIEQHAAAEGEAFTVALVAHPTTEEHRMSRASATETTFEVDVDPGARPGRRSRSSGPGPPSRGSGGCRASSAAAPRSRSSTSSGSPCASSISRVPTR